MMKRFAALVASLMAAMLPHCAFAQAVQPNQLQPREDDYLSRNNASEIAILLRADVPLECAVIFDESSASVDLTTTRAYQVGVRVNCNAPFRMTGRARNGALRNTSAFSANNPRTFLPYTVRWPAMVTNDGDAIAPQFTASGESWARGVEFVSSTAVIKQIGALQIEWPRPNDLVAGEYTETFVVELEAVD